MTSPQNDEKTLPIGRGVCLFDEETGEPTAFVAPGAPNREYLIPLSVSWHSRDFEWGSGAITTSRGSARWNTPTRTSWTPQSEKLDFRLPSTGFRLEVTRQGGEKLVETYRWINCSNQPATITSLSIQTPFNDRYPSAKESLETCVNAHIFAGGSDAWVYAEPMDGSSPSLGLSVKKGSINSYSLETQSPAFCSNYRGHIVLNVTDSAVSPSSFGGQPTFDVPAGGEYCLQWELGWYRTRQQFLEENPEPMRFSRMAAPLGKDISVETSLQPTCSDKNLNISRKGRLWRLSSNVPGIFRIILRGEKMRVVTEVLFFEPLRTVVRKRVHYILDHQVSSYRPGVLSGALVAVDTRSGIQCIDPQWSDWTDGSERIGMAVLLQKAVNAGWLDGKDRCRAQEECDKWSVFCASKLLDSTGAARRGSDKPSSTFGSRLYDMPWIAQFYCEHYLASSKPSDLEKADQILSRYFQLGGEHFLAIGIAQAVSHVAGVLEKNGQRGKAEELETKLVSSAHHFLRSGVNLPAHEVSYEQAMIAPLLSLLIEGYRLTHESSLLEGIKTRLPWLLSFSGFQQDARLNGIAIRHWDDEFFGIDRTYGDVFPHYWSALTAEVLAELPNEIRSPQFLTLAQHILEENMANYFPDGSATCAFVFPSSVDRRPMNRKDPMANDQDWHLVIWMDLIGKSWTPKSPAQEDRENKTRKRIRSSQN